MGNSIYHHRHAVLDTTGTTPLKGGASIALFDDGKVILTLTAANGAVSTNIHINADSLRAFAKLLNDAVDALPAKVEEAA